MGDRMKFTWFENNGGQLEDFLNDLANDYDAEDEFYAFEDISSHNKTIKGDGGNNGEKGVTYKVISLDTLNRREIGDEYRIWVEALDQVGGRRKRRKSKRKKSRKSRKRSKRSKRSKRR